MKIYRLIKISGNVIKITFILDIIFMLRALYLCTELHQILFYIEFCIITWKIYDSFDNATSV